MNIHLKMTTVAVLGVFVAACQGAGTDNAGVAANPQAPQAADSADAIAALPGLTPRERYRTAIRFLESGDPRHARAELLAYMGEVKASSRLRAQNLLAQIDTPIETYYPADSFTVTLGSGESLSTLAKAYLGDAMQFYALARYNSIADPSRVRVGQAIKVPLTQFAIAARKNETQMADAADAQAEVEIAEAEAEAGVEEMAEDLAEIAPSAASPADAAMIDPAADSADVAATLADSHGAEVTMASVEGAYDAGDIHAAVEQLDALRAGRDLTTSQANIAADIYADYADTLAEGDPDAAAGYFVTASALYRSTGRDDEAFEVLEAASALRPGDAETAGALTRVRNELADKYHRQASAAYRRQQLDEAIAIWDHVLEIDPDHNNAQVLRAQAMELKDRLSKLNNGAQQ